jgi:hypothetical protein
MPEVTAEEMAKAKVGFAVRFINPHLVADVMLPDDLQVHNQAVIEFFLTVQEEAEVRLGKLIVFSSLSIWTDTRLLATIDKPTPMGAAKTNVNVKSFLKVEDGNPFYVLPVISEPLFPQFRGPRTPGVTRSERQRGALLSLLRKIARRLMMRIARCIGKISLDPSKLCLRLSSLPH